MALQPCLFATSLFLATATVSDTKPANQDGKSVSPVGLEDFMVPGACEEACSLQWWTTEVITFNSEEECFNAICDPLQQHVKLRSIVFDGDRIKSTAELPSIEDVLLNCAAKCDAEWWLDGIEFDSDIHCKETLCSGIQQLLVPSKTSESKNEQQQMISEETAKTNKLLHRGNKSSSSEPLVLVVTHASAERKSQHGCYRHKECSDYEFCSRDNVCRALGECDNGKGFVKVNTDVSAPIDGLCPVVSLGRKDEVSSETESIVEEEEEVQIEFKHQNASDNSVLTASSSDISSPVQRVDIFAGQYIDKIQFTYESGCVKAFGEEGGFQQRPFLIPNGEYITWIKVWQGHHLDGIQLFTNKGTASPRYGNEGGRKRMFHVKRGNELWGLERLVDDTSGLASPIAAVYERPRSIYDM